MNARNPRYRFTFAYYTENRNGKTMYGKLDERVVNLIDLETTLKVLSPLKCMEWLENVGRLGRGGYVVFEVDGVEETDENIPIRLRKLLRIQRN